MDNLLIYLQSLASLSSEGWDALQPALKRKSFKKGAFLLRTGDVCRTLFFIESGYCRSFVDMDGLEKNTGFFFENNIATDLDSFGSGQKAESQIIACEAVSAILFNREKLFAVARSRPEIEALGRSCIRQFASRQEAFSRLLRLYSPLERVSFLEKHHPYMLQRIPLSQLASFLGITRESLSRIRKRRMSS